WIDGAELSPDGKRLLIVQPQGYDVEAKSPKTPISMLDADSFEELWSIDDKNQFSRYFAFSPDGSRLLVSTQVAQDAKLEKPLQPVLRSYDVASGKLVEEVKTEALGPMAFRGDSLLIGGSEP